MILWSLRAVGWDRGTPDLMARSFPVGLPTYLGLGLLYLFVPVVLVILFSFNDHQRPLQCSLAGIHSDHWLDPFRVQDMPRAYGRAL